jgi:hypothetical protein
MSTLRVVLIPSNFLRQEKYLPCWARSEKRVGKWKSGNDIFWIFFFSIWRSEGWAFTVKNLGTVRTLARAPLPPAHGAHKMTAICKNGSKQILSWGSHPRFLDSWGAWDDIWKFLGHLVSSSGVGAQFKPYSWFIYFIFLLSCWVGGTLRHL